MTTSIWRGTAPATNFPVLEGEVSADVAIVGGGITGMTAALMLSREGLSVVLVEARSVGQGSTGNSTGNLYEVLSRRLYTVGDKWGKDVMRAVAQSRREAVDFVAATVGQLGIDCGFMPRALHLYSTTPDQQEAVEREYEAARDCGMTAHMANDLPVPIEHGQALVIERQAQFHPLAYVQGIARAVAGDRCRIYEHSPVLSLDAENHTITTPRGRVVAKEVVLATHTPKGVYLVQAEMVPYREYGLGLRLASGVYPQGVFWGVGDYRHSVRSLETEGVQRLIVVGEEHKTGEARDTSECLARLEAFARRNFDVAQVEFGWSAQNYSPADGLPYIGEGSSGILFATGFGTDGLTWGTVAARILTDAILKRPNPWADHYRASRFTPIKGAKGMLEENLTVAKSLLKDYLTPRQHALLSEIAPDTGRIVDVEGETVAAYREADGTLHAVSPVCPHLKCMVRWNAAERSWDCPCHGSRYDVDGAVIEGPTLAPLQQRHRHP